jgi:hypothetical protein
MFIVPVAYFRFAHKTITATVRETSRGTVDVSISRGSIRVRTMACSEGGDADDRRRRLGRFFWFGTDEDAVAALDRLSRHAF